MYLLDTNILSELVRSRPNPNVEARFETETEALFTSVICIEEIRYGAKIAPSNKLWARTETQIIPRVTALPLDLGVAVAAADLRAEWKIKGTPVGYRDGLIAATARGMGLTLVTRNVRHFDHVLGLNVENWFEPPAASPPGAPPPSSRKRPRNRALRLSASVSSIFLFVSSFSRAGNTAPAQFVALLPGCRMGSVRPASSSSKGQCSIAKSNPDNQAAR